MAKLSELEIQRRLRKLRGWKREGNFLVKKYRFRTFMEAVAFMNRLFAAAEAANHHPDLYNVWAFVTVKWTTHDAGGLTGRDFRMAATCDRLG